MDLTSLLPDPKDIDKMRSELYYIRNVLAASVRDYAERALRSSNNVLGIAREGGVIAATFKDQRTYNISSQRCTEAMKALHMVNYGILNLEAVPEDPEAQDINEEFKFDSLDLEQISAYLEGAERRIELASASFPPKPRPTMRLNSDIYTTKTEEPPEGDQSA